MATWEVEFTAKTYDASTGRVVLTFNAYEDGTQRFVGLEVRVDWSQSRAQALQLIRERIRQAVLGESSATALLGQVPLNRRFVVWDSSEG